MKTIWIILLFAGIVAVIGIAFFWPNGLPSGWEGAMSAQHQQKTAPSAPAFFNLVLEDYEGKAVRLADFRGRPLVINSWAAWCSFCKKELVDFAAAQKELGDAVLILAVNRAEAKDTAQKYTDELGVTDAFLFLIDSSDSFYTSIGGFSMPETIFVDRDGNVKIHKRGLMDLDEIRDKIKEIL